MYDDVAKFVLTCDQCNRSNPNNRPIPAELQPIPVKELFHRWGLDLIGPLKESPSGNKYLAVAIEYLSNWPEVKPIKSKSAEEVATFFLSIIYRFGAMTCIIHDQGKEFMNTVLDNICKKFNISNNITAAYHPQVLFIKFQKLSNFLRNFYLF